MTYDFTRRETLALAAAAALAPFPAEALALPGDRAVSRIAFGSCAHQDKPQPIWSDVLGYRPDLFVFLGDNIYADTEDMAVMKAKYAKLAAKPGFRQLRETCPLVAIWDDHDYGKNDAGREYPRKQDSKELFLDFWNEPANSPRRSREGNYTSYVFGPEGRRVQLILPDHRWFRSGLLGNTEVPEDRGPYLPNFDPAATLLGPAQWEWLEAELRQPADIRVMGMSTQVLADAPGWEAWVNYPFERQRLFDMIDFTEAKGLLFISGDTHYTELSRLTEGTPYPFYDLTSSGLTEVWPYVAPNRNRVGEGYAQANFGSLTIDWEQPDPTILLETRAVGGKVLISRKVRLSELA